MSMSLPVPRQTNLTFWSCSFSLHYHLRHKCCSAGNTTVLQSSPQSQSLFSLLLLFLAAGLLWPDGLPFLGKMASSISPGGKRGRSSSNGSPSLLISYLSEQPSTICTVLVSLSLLSIAVIAINLVIILSSKIILCFQIPFHRRRHFLPTSDGATPRLSISVLFSSSCKRPVLKVKAQDQAIKFWVQSE